ncbi:peptidase S8 S53 subtilisin kexin sedolisin [Fusarium mundagurra]|uniref:Peptidase S8 S53 subtilisin kexin sedolisin n=1 Tax=Fusarium mundagurra TaxID=1567541 RepID=A0A8H6D5P7_9HYPO|nr:peptidase S8 S53 subtilisin kexin sedolisin [Fusarium mundagurra]
MTRTNDGQRASDLPQGYINEPDNGHEMERTSSAPKTSRRQSQDGSSYRRNSFEFAKGQSGKDRLDSDSDSEPEKPVVRRQEASDDQDIPTKQQDRESLMKALGQSWATFEEYKTANGEKISRCYTADQNKNILHWLSVHLPSHLSDEENRNLHWLVSVVVEFEPTIVTMTTMDSQKANCLHTAMENQRFDLIESLLKASPDEALRKAISQGNHCNETPLHLAVRHGAPGVGIILQLLEKADAKAVLQQRAYTFEEDKPNHRNTVLHDFVHIKVCAFRGYRKTLKRLIQLCPEALKVSNAARESPFQFHLSTRDREHPDWQGVEFSSPNERYEKNKETAARVGRLLLNEAFSQLTWEDACSCLYGEKTFDQATTFKPAAPINKRIDRSHSFLQFYPILSYVELVLARSAHTDPRHDTSLYLTGKHDDSSTASEWAERIDSIKRVFSWFRKQRKVKRILSLVVIDDAESPCSDEVIVECLRDFDIRYLKWTKDDLCIDVLHTAGLFSVKELWLQWSGRNSVLYSWSCKDTGLAKLQKLEMVHIHTRAGVESTRINKKNLESFNVRLKESVDSVQIDEYRKDLTRRVTETLETDLAPLGSKVQKSMSEWTGGPDYVQIAKAGKGEPPPMIEATIAGFEARAMFNRKGTKGFREIRVDDASHENPNEGNGSKRTERQEQKYVIDLLRNEKQGSDSSSLRGHRWLDAARRLNTAINIHRQNNQLTVRPIRVALLDDGVTPSELVVPGVLKDGWPLPSTSRLHSFKPYYSSEQGHGTKMARLLYFMCPFISIYVAKIDMYREHDASAAMQSTGLSSGPGSNQNAITSLERAIQAAANDDILLFCAVQDSSHYESNTQSFPQKSDTKKLIIVGSADEDGDRSKFVNENSFNYLFPGEIVIPEILTEDDKGSSVATAVAAGTAAMILWCAEYHSLATRSKENAKGDQSSLGTAPDATSLANLGPLRESKTGLRTTPEWDFRHDGRMSALFDALKPDKDKFVDITSTINAVMASIDEFHGTDLETQKSCIEEFVLMCKGNLPLSLR